MLRYALLSESAKAWRSLQCPISELRLDLVLTCGQSFRWRETGDGHWTGVVGGKVWTLTQTNDTLWYYVYPSQNKTEIRDADLGSVVAGLDNSAEEDLLRDYFQLDVKLETLYRDWCHNDHHFNQIANIFTGVRMLRQDPAECLFSFICSSNNHISRIQGMVERLCLKLGPRLATIEDTHYHSFPSLKDLADGTVESCLREQGFGYRARFIQQSAQLILNSHGPNWLMELRDVPYADACTSLRTLPGVGMKVADCVCLMSLDKPGAVPVDTHMWQIATRDYGFSSGKGMKTLTDKVHHEIGDFFRQRWGPYAGWAHSVLFCADLKRFQDLKEKVKVEKKGLKSEADVSRSKKKQHRSAEPKTAEVLTSKRPKKEKP